MKKLVIFCFIFSASYLFPHQQNLHQHIIREAFKLLVLAYPELQNSEMATYIGNSETNGSSIYKSWGDGTVAAGGWIEDEYDIVYHYGTWENPDFNQTLTPELTEIFLMSEDTQRKSFVSITHFWNADGGLNCLTDLSDYALNIYWSYSCENAMQKMLKYYNGDYQNRMLAQSQVGWPSLCNYIGAQAVDFSMQNLIDLYKNFGSIKIGATQYFYLGAWNETSCPELYFQKKWIFEILGRMCHLLGDMSVPAHVHCNSHAGEYGMYSDLYENSELNYHMWTAAEIYNQGKTFINPYNTWSDPLYYLMYYMNQITDHYASGKTNGDDNYDTNCPGLAEAFTSLGLPVSTAQVNQINLSSMHDVLLPFAIRATAGLMYWFATQTGILHVQIPIYVNKTFEFDETEILNQNGYIAEQTTITVPSTISKNGRQYIFAGWEDGNNSNPRTIIPIGPTTYNAIYKVLHKSNNVSAFSRNSQRKLIQTNAEGTRWLHQVYSSMGHAWIEHSSDNGSTWVLGNNGRPLDVGGGKCPSIAFMKDGSINCIAVVWQQKYGDHYTIEGKMFNQGIGIPVSVPTTSLFTEPVDLYDNVDANPNVIIEDGLGEGYLVVFERKTTSGSYSKGLYYLVGELRYEGVSGPFTGVQLQGVIADTYGTTLTAKNAQLSLNPSCYNWAYRITADIIFEYGPYVKQIYLDFQKTSDSWHMAQPFVTNTISTSSGINYNPSIVAHQDNEYSACWINNIEGNEDGSWADVDQMVYYFSMYPSVRYYMGYGVQSCAVNAGGYSSGFAAWSQIYNSTWSNKSVKFSYGTPTTGDIRTLNTTGKYIQLSNSVSSDLNNMYVSSFSQLTSPYYFSTSSSLVPVNKQTGPVVGRGCIISKDDAAFTYRIDGLNADGVDIGFAEANDSLDYNNLSILNSVLISELLKLKSDSKLLFTEFSGFADSAAALKVLGTDKYINAVVELVDGASGETIGTIKNIAVNSSNCQPFTVHSYSINAAGIENGNVKLKITFSTNIEDPEIILTKSFSDVNLALEKSALNEIAVNGTDIPTTYALSQNYPNPFNPSTTINYQLPADGMVTLKIYDALGREVKTLVEEFKQRGRYSINFNASELASGVYFYRLQVHDFTSSKKLVLMK